MNEQNETNNRSNQNPQLQGERSFLEKKNDISDRLEKNPQLRKSATSLLWASILLFYLLISFLTNHWGQTWMLFIIGIPLQLGINSAFKGGKMTTGIIIIASIVVYLVISFSTGQWQLTWLIFIAAVAVERGMKFYNIWNNK